MSLIFGCLYVIRFETMRRPHKAMQWAKVSTDPRSSIPDAKLLIRTRWLIAAHGGTSSFYSPFPLSGLHGTVITIHFPVHTALTPARQGRSFSF